MIRAAGGNNDHPDSVKFPYLYKLLSTYSLLKPPKGSNVSNEESFTTFSNLMLANHVIGKEEERNFSARDIWNFAMDYGAAEIEDEEELHGNYDDIINDLDDSERCKIEYFAGYVVKKAMKRFTKCEDCKKSLQGERDAAGSLLSGRDKFSVLYVPSHGLVNLLSYLERKVNEEVGSSVRDLKPDTFFNICRKLDRSVVNVQSIGCNVEHGDELLTKLTHFYLMTRIHLVMREAKKQNKNIAKSKSLKKQSKLV